MAQQVLAWVASVKREGRRGNLGAQEREGYTHEEGESTTGETGS